MDWFPIHYFHDKEKISDNKFVKTLTDATTLTGIVAGIEWLSKKVIKEPMNFDPSSNLMNYVEFTMDVVATSSCSKTKSWRLQDFAFFFFIYQNGKYDHENSKRDHPRTNWDYKESVVEEEVNERLPGKHGEATNK